MKYVLIFALVAAVTSIGCGPSYVRGTENPDLDNYAMSTGLDKVDLEQLFDENIKSLMESPAVAKWNEMADPPLVSIFPIANETSEHIREQLDTLLSKVETQLINSGMATVVDRAQQTALIEEIKRQQGAEFDDAKSAQVGRQLGAKYFITGKVTSSSERAEGEKRVQYFLFMKIVEVETAAIRWQNEANLTKGLVK